MEYYSSFAAGFDELAVRALSERLRDASEIRALGGAVAYKSAAGPGAVRSLGFFKNSFILLRGFPDAPDIESLAAAAARNPGKIEAPKLARTFGLRILDENVPAAAGAARARLADAISRKTGLAYRAGAADTEFHLSLRRGGAGFLLQKISAEPEPPAGALAPHVAALLCLATNPKEGDVFLDPFAGGGSIPLARARVAGYAGIFAMDSDREAAAALRAKIKSTRNSKIQKSFFAKCGDFLENRFDDGFFDAIATDPPWGLHQKIGDGFYERMMREFARILVRGGRLVVLMGRDIEVPARDDLAPIDSFGVLIHGRKATVWRFVKK
jgi:16S rRNA G966 N2-methylase RsmD